MQWLSMVILPISVAIVVLALTVTGRVPYIRNLSLFFIIFPGAFGFVSAGIISKKKASNRNIKIFGKGYIKIISNGEESVFAGSDINELNYTLQEDSEGLKRTGILFFKDSNNTKHDLLTIWDEDRKYLADNLNYLKDHLNNFIFS